MNAYILTEITKRELDSNILLACIAAHNDFEVMISNGDTIKNLNSKKILKKGIFHTKSLVHGEKKKKLHGKIKENGHKITCLDEESGLILDDLSFFCESRFNNEELSVVDRVFCWGTHDYESLQSMYPNHKEKFILSGSPRIDILQKKLKKYWEDQDDKKNILISSNFNLVNGYIETSKIIKEIEKQGFFKRSQDYKEFLNIVIPETKKKFENFQIMSKELISSFPNEHFVFRPHPMENPLFWKDFFQDHKNIKVSNQGNINSQLLNCKILIHNSCTTAFQSYMFHIPTLSYEPFKSLSNYGNPANELSDRIQDLRLLKNKVKEILDKKFDHSKKDEKTKTFNFKVFIPNGLYSSDIIVKSWREILYQNDEQKNNWKRIKFELKILQIKDFVLKFLIRILKPSKNLYFDRKFETISEEEILEKVKKISNLLNLKNISCEKLSDKSFVVKKVN